MDGEGTSLLTLVLTSSAIATIATTILKYAFDIYIVPKISGRRSADEKVDRLRPQLIESAEAAGSYVRLLLRFRSRRWFSAEDDYFRLSILYAMAEFFAWHHIVSRYAHPEVAKSSSIASVFGKYSRRTLKPLSGFGYQKDFSRRELEAFENQEVPRRAIQAIAELMITDEEGGEFPGTIKFIDFVKRYETDPDFKRWFAFLEEAFRAIENRDEKTLYFDRFVIFTIALQVFVRKMHPKRAVRIGKRLILFNIYDIDERSAAIVHDELVGDRLSFEYPFKRGSDEPPFRYEPPRLIETLNQRIDSYLRHSPDNPEGGKPADERKKRVGGGQDRS